MEILFVSVPVLFCVLPILFLLVGGSFLLGISWILGSINRRTVVVTVKHVESRVSGENTINLFICQLKDGRTITLNNSVSIYGWKMIKKVMIINATLKKDGKYRLTVAGPDWFYGQNIFEVEEIK